MHRTTWAFAAFFVLDASAWLKSAKKAFHVRCFFHSARRQKNFRHLRRSLEQATQGITGAKFASAFYKIQFAFFHLRHIFNH
jgi:hypothetical protein